MSSSRYSTLATASQLMPSSSKTRAFARRAKRCATEPSRISSIRSCRDLMSRKPARIIQPAKSDSASLASDSFGFSQSSGIACKVLGKVTKADGRSFTNPYVRSRRPSLRPDLLSLTQGGEWWSRMAVGHREAAPSVLEDHSPPCDACSRRVPLCVTSRFRFPQSLQRVGKRKREVHQKA